MRTKELVIVLGAETDAETDPILKKCLRQSQKDKKAGRIRKYEDVAQECGLRI